MLRKSILSNGRGFSSASSALATERLKGKFAVITGGASGIGKETAFLFARNGVEGMLLADLNTFALDDTVFNIYKEMDDRGLKRPDIIGLKTDVSKSSQCENMIATAEKQFGSVNVLFNNAGIMHSDDGDAVHTEEDVWDLTMDINVKGVWFGCKYGIPALRRAGGGSIINTASFVALLGAATPQLAYTSSKGAVLAMTRELAVIHAKESIRVNALCPGPVRTDLLMNFLNTDEKKHRRLVHVPMGRFGEAVEMAQGAVFLASDESSYVTGTEFMVDGGLTAAYVTPE